MRRVQTSSQHDEHQVDGRAGRSAERDEGRGVAEIHARNLRSGRPKTFRAVGPYCSSYWTL